MAEQAQDWFAANAPKSVPPPAAAVTPKGGDWFAANAPKAPAASTDDSGGLSLHELSSSNPQKEGLYHMKDADGHSYAVPFSNVELAGDNWRDMFVNEKEAEQYEKDKKAQPQAPLDRTAANYGKEIVYGVGRGLKNDVVGTYETVRHPIDTATGMVHQTKEAMDAASKSREEERGSSVGARLAAPVLAFAEKAPVVGGMVQKAESGKGYASPESVGASAEAITTLEAPDLAIKGIKAIPGKVVELPTTVARKLSGTGEGLTKREVAEQAAANKEIQRKVAEEYDPAYKKKVAAVEEKNVQERQDFEDAKRKRSNLVDEKAKRSRTLQEAKTRVFQHVKNIDSAATNWFNGQYNDLAKQTSGARVDLDPLTEAVDSAKLQDLADPITKVPIFDDIIKKSKGEAGEGADARPPADWGEMSHEARKAWRDEQLNSSGATYRYLLGKYRQIGKLMKSPSLDPSVRTGLANVRNVIERMQTEAAKIADEQAPERHAEDMSEWERDVAERGESVAGPKPTMPTRKASSINYSIGNAYRNFAQSYRDAGAIGTKIVDPSKTLESGTAHLTKELADADLSDAKRTLIGKEEAGGKATHATQWARRLAKGDEARLRFGKNLTQTELRRQTGELIDNLRKRQAEYDAVPDPGNAPELKLTPAPKYKPPQEKPYSEQKLKNSREAQLNRRIEFFSSPNFRMGARGLTTFGIADVVAKVLGFHEGVALTAGGISALSYLLPTQIVKLLSDPAMQEKLFTITSKDREILAKLPANQRAIVEQNLINIERVAKQKGIIPKDASVPMANFAKKDIVKAKEEAAKAKEEPKPEPPPEEPPAAAAPAPEPPPTPPAAPAAAPETPPAAPQAATPPPAPTVSAQLSPAPDVIDKDEKGRPILDVSQMQPGQIGRVRLEDLQLDPRRFQYKLSPDENGITNKLQGKNWDENLAGIIQVWKDPESGETYVINGHHRFEMAERFKVPNVDVRMIEAPDDVTARAIGAMQNLADGRGTALDAAKFLRDSGMTPEKMKHTNLNLGGEAIVREGLSLSTLSDGMFNRVVDGDVDPKVGAAIADSAPSPEQQESLLKYIRDYEKKTGRDLSPSLIRTMGERMKRSMTDVKGKPAAQAGLWGEEEMQDHLLGEMAEVTEYVEKKLKDRRKTLKGNASESAAETMMEHGATFDHKAVGASAKTEAEILNLFKSESDKVGYVDDMIRNAAEDLHEGDMDPNEIKRETAKKIRGHLEGKHEELTK
jgi:hypothetical protein